MTVATDQIAVRSGGHLVKFYSCDSELFHRVGAYLADAIRADGVGITIATPAHLQGFEAALKASHLDPAAARANGNLVSVDAAAMLARLMPAGKIDGSAFEEVVGTLIGGVAATGRTVHAYGEMVALLWEAGDVLAAIELEQLWNDLQGELDFSLLCAYRSESTSTAEHADALQKVCSLHSASEASAHFPARRDAPRSARRFVARATRHWGASERLVEEAQLVVSELATNAVVHANSPFSVLVRLSRSGLRLSVRDELAAEPKVQEPAPRTASGRGLRTLAALAADWGFEPTPGGKVVWVELQ